jgi:hypothetical protein
VGDYKVLHRGSGASNSADIYTVAFGSDQVAPLAFAHFSYRCPDVVVECAVEIQPGPDQADGEIVKCLFWRGHLIDCKEGLDANCMPYGQFDAAIKTILMSSAVTAADGKYREPLKAANRLGPRAIAHHVHAGRSDIDSLLRRQSSGWGFLDSTVAVDFELGWAAHSPPGLDSYAPGLSPFIPRLDPDRILQLASLCADDDALAGLIGSDFGLLANGLHVLAPMARLARWQTVEAAGVGNILEHASFTIPDRRRLRQMFTSMPARTDAPAPPPVCEPLTQRLERTYGSLPRLENMQDLHQAIQRALWIGVKQAPQIEAERQETMAAYTLTSLAASGLPQAWEFLCEQHEDGILPFATPEYIAFSALSNPEDVDTAVASLGSAVFDLLEERHLERLPCEVKARQPDAELANSLAKVLAAPHTVHGPRIATVTQMPEARRERERSVPQRAISAGATQ